MALIAGIFLGGVTLIWAWRASGRFLPLGALSDLVIVSYLCLILLLFQRRLRIGIMVVPTLLLGVHLAAILKREILQADVEPSDLLLLDDLAVHYLAEGAWALVPAGLLAIPAGLLLCNLRLPRPAEWLLLLPGFGYAALLAGKLYVGGALAAILPPSASDYHWFPSAYQVGHWGTLLQSGLSLADRKQRVTELAARVAPDHGFLAAELRIDRPRNLHILVLESLIDPATIPGLSLKPDPFAPMFQDWRRADGPRAMQPVLGGRSPDGEFEVLCGLPATLDGGQVVFAQLADAEVDCLPNKLRRLGYATETWVPVAPSEFNYDRAYRQIGFVTRRFAPDLDMRDRDGEGLSAASLLRQNLLHVAAAMADGKPLLNYVFVTAGHFPYSLDLEKRPHRVTASPPSALLAAYANCAYYTTHAVESYVKALRRIDPSAIILVIGDHPPGLPALPDGITYPRLMENRYDVPLLLFDGPAGRIALTGQVPGYHLPAILADLLTGGAFCGDNRCPHRDARAIRPLPQGALLVDRANGTTRLCSATLADADCKEAIRESERARLALYGLFGLR